MSLVLKLSKCRLCLKLGDFYSIFAVDNSIQLSKMAMACSEIKIYEGDGLPEKVCGECIEKLSSAYIFKQQCERSDAELRKSLQNTSGGAEILSFGRRNSDSGFSNRTDVSTSKREIHATRSKSKKSNGPSPERTAYPTGGLLEESYSIDVRDQIYQGASSTPVPYNKHLGKNTSDSGSNSPIITDQTRFECKKCNKTFLNIKTQRAHMKNIHASSDEEEEEDDEEEEVKEIVPDVKTTNHGETSQDNNSSITRDQSDCHLCGKQFKFNIMLNRHRLTCQGPPVVVAEPIVEDAKKRFSASALVPVTCLKCPVCGKVFKKRLYVMRHLTRSVCGEIAKEFPEDKPAKVKEDKTASKAAKSAFVSECSICTARFSSHTSMFKHFQLCIRRRGGGPIKCVTCKTTYSHKSGLYRHIKKMHYPDEVAGKAKKRTGGMDIVKDEPLSEPDDNAEDEGGSLKCRECDKTFSDQMQLVMHLAAHMANINEPKGSLKTKIGFDGTEYECLECSKKFKYKGNMRVHLKQQHNYSIDIIHRLEESLSEFKCDMCDKAFQFEKSLTYHKNSKHNKLTALASPQPIQSIVVPIIPDPNLSHTDVIVFTKCPARCLHCNVMLNNLKETKKHNRLHMDANVKPKNEYTCPACGVKFTNTKYFSIHIAEHNANTNADSQQASDGDDDEINVMDFCESVVANIKQEGGAGHGGSTLGVGGQQLVVALGGFTCTICSKRLASVEQYESHMVWHNKRANASSPTGPKVVVCPICSESFRFDSHLRDHMRQHALAAKEDPTLLNCKICPRTTKNLRGYIAHMNWHSSASNFRCPVCLKQFSQRGHLTTHYRTHVKKNETRLNDVFDHQSGKVTDFQCHICKKYMPTLVSLTFHVRWHSSTAGRAAMRYECSKCNVAFTNKTRHIMHMRIHADSNSPYKCHICGRGCKSPAHLTSHIKSHSFANRLRKNALKVLCPVCEQVYPSQLKLQRHIRRSHPESKMVKKNDPGAEDLPIIRHICRICGKEFHTEHKLKMHTRRHNIKPNFYICSICDKRTLSLKVHNMHIKGHLNEKFKDCPIKCNYCEERFVRRKELHVHVYKVHDILENYISKVDNKKNITELKEYQCHVCFKVLAHESTYLRHLDYHNTMRCNYCFKYFTNKTFAQAHTMYDCDRKKMLGGNDTFDKKLKCPVCYKAFAVSVKLHCHMKVQHNLQPTESCLEQDRATVCDFCFITQPSEKQMLRHRSVHLRFNTYYGCHFCPKKFCTMSLFFRHKKNHLNRHYTENPLQCEDCPENFVYFHDYSTHLQDVHGKEVNWVIMPKPSPVQECPICKKRFSHLHNHLMYHEKFKCKHCSEYFFSDTSFAAHPCPEGDIEDEEEETTAVAVPQALTFNKQFNRILEPYEECDFCFKPYSTNYTKGMHDTTHKKMLSFGCLYCNKTFTSHALFKLHAPSHRLRHYKSNPLLCKHCGETFIKFGLYLRHLKEVHNDKESMILRPSYPPEECKICKKTFECIHHHYRFHMQFRCTSCLKYIVSEKLFKAHICGNEDEDQTKIFEYDGDIQPLSVGMFDYDTLRHRSINANPVVDASSDQSKDFSLEDIDITPTELDSSALNSVDLTNMSYSPDITDSNQDMIVSIPDQVLFGNYTPSNSNASFENFTPVISSTVSLSSNPAIITPEEELNERKDEEEDMILELDTDSEVDEGKESAEELIKIVDDLENSFTLPSEDASQEKE